MSSQKVWDFWAPHYKNLWVQKVSLQPTRAQVLKKMHQLYPHKTIQSYLDVGCGVGELIESIESNFITGNSYGLDYSPAMIERATSLPLKTEWLCEDIHHFKPPAKVDLILCTHSFPYYKNQDDVLHRFNNMLNKEGRLLIAFASKNSLYDILCMTAVKLTTGRAKYPSVAQFLALSSDEFYHRSTSRIKEKWYMPSIYLFEMEPKHD